MANYIDFNQFTLKLEHIDDKDIHTKFLSGSMFLFLLKW